MEKDEMAALRNGSDIRGVAIDGVEGERVNLTPSRCARAAEAFALWLAEKSGKKARELSIGLGRDARLSSGRLADAAARGLSAAGARAVGCGLATTPAMFMSTVFSQTRFDGAVMVTASHLPFNRNGMKFFGRDGCLEPADISSMLARAAEMEEPHAMDAPIPEFNLMEIYSESLRREIMKETGAEDGAKPLAGLKIIVDAGNGDAGFFARDILAPLGADTAGSQFLDPDGTFPNHIPNPENKRAMDSIRAAVIKNGADLGLIFDTDVDRMSAVLGDGTEASRDAIIALAAAVIAPSCPGGTIVTDSVTSDRLTRFLEDELGMRHLRYMRGYKNVIDKCKALNAAGTPSPLAMETSGHGALKDNHYLDDGAFLAVKIVSALAKASREGKTLKSLIEKLPPPGVEGEFRLKINRADFRESGEAVLREFEGRARRAGLALPKSFEGVRISFDGDGARGWLLLRMSLHDPVMPLNIEADSESGFEKIKGCAKKLLEGFDFLSPA